MKQLLLGMSGKKVFIKNNRIYKEIKDQTNKNIFLINLNKLNCKFIPTYYGQKDGYEIFEYVKGKTYKNIRHPSKKSINSVIKFLIYFQTFCIKNFGYILSHNDLSPFNVIMNGNGKLKKVIDGDNLEKGHKYDDLVYIVGIWCNFGSNSKSDFGKIKRISFVLTKYIKFSKNLNLNEFSFKVKEQMQLHFLNRKSNFKMNFNEITEWFNYCFRWGDINGIKIKDNLNKRGICDEKNF